MKVWPCYNLSHQDIKPSSSATLTSLVPLPLLFIMQVVEMPAPRPMLSRRNMANGDTSYEGGSSTYIGDAKTSSPHGATTDLEEKNVAVRPNPHRKYSQQWFTHAWDQAVEVGRWPRLTYLAVGIVLVIVWIGIM